VVVVVWTQEFAHIDWLRLSIQQEQFAGHLLLVWKICWNQLKECWVI
jgi:hypothetical protein